VRLAGAALSFDDGWRSGHELAAPLMAEYGYRGTFYVNPATVETSGFLTASDLLRLHARGHDVAAHGYEDVDLTGLSAPQIDWQLAEARDSLADVGLVTRDLAVPFGRSDPQVEWHARKYFESMRGMDSGINTRQDFDPYDLKVFTVDSHTTPEEFRRALVEAVTSHGWLILVYHRMTDEVSAEAERSTVTADAFASQLAMLSASGIHVEPVSRAFAEVSAQ
jgi:peptidoglycan/xylan/chitin deacetylase (PgdA/CDA1 family)